MIRSHGLIAATILGATSVVALTQKDARADMTPPPSPHSGVEGRSTGPSTTIDDTRFGEIGRTGPDPNEALKPPISTGVAANRVGNVTYAGARVDVPMSTRWSVIPQAAMLHITPYAAGDPTVFVPYIGGGIGHRPAPSWSLELSGLYGPMSYGIESWTAIAGVSKEIGGDWSRDIAPPIAVQLAASWNRFRWASGNGPAGNTITQYFGQLEVLWRATRRLQVSPRGMLFAYDKSLEGATGPRLGTVSVLSQVGVYAPRYMFGGRVGYLIGERVFPFIDAQRIGYAAGIGEGTQVAGGLRVKLGSRASVMAMGGVLYNRTSGPLVTPNYDLSRVPVIGTEIELAF